MGVIFNKNKVIWLTLTTLPAESGEYWCSSELLLIPFYKTQDYELLEWYNSTSQKLWRFHPISYITIKLLFWLISIIVLFLLSTCGRLSCTLNQNVLHSSVFVSSFAFTSLPGPAAEMHQHRTVYLVSDKHAVTTNAQPPKRVKKNSDGGVDPSEFFCLLCFALLEVPQQKSKWVTDGVK